MTKEIVGNIPECEFRKEEEKERKGIFLSIS